MFKDEPDVDDLIDEQFEAEKRGQPTEYTIERAKEICESIALGMTMKDAANLAGVKYKTALTWRDKHKEFKDMYSRAKLEMKQSLIASVRVGAIKDPRVALEALARMYPQEWSKQKLFAMVKQTDKAKELVMLLFGEVTGDMLEQKDDDVIDAIDAGLISSPSTDEDRDE